jgi:hypothetical protein
MNETQKRALWREHIIITVQFVLTAWLGAVHALAVLMVFVLLRYPQLFNAPYTPEKAGAIADSYSLFFMAITGPGIVLWVIKEFISWTLPVVKGDATPRNDRRIPFIPVWEFGLMVWLVAVHSAAGCFVSFLSHDAKAMEYLIGAFTDANAGKAMMISIALMAGPGIALWIAASRRLVRRTGLRGLFGLQDQEVSRGPERNAGDHPGAVR